MHPFISGKNYFLYLNICEWRLVKERTPIAFSYLDTNISIIFPCEIFSQLFLSCSPKPESDR